MEEIRETYGPVLYRLTAYINHIYAALALVEASLSTLPEDGVETALQLMKRGLVVYESELAACLVTTLAVFKNSPMISVAESASYAE